MNENWEATALNIEKSINNSWATSWSCDSLHANFSCFVPGWPNLDFFQFTSRKALQCLQPWLRVGGWGQALNGRCLVVNYAPNPLPQRGVCVCACERERENVSMCVASQLDWSIQASWVLQYFSFVMGFGVIEHSRLIYQRRQWHPTPVLWPVKSHGWRSLEGCSPWGRWLSDFTFTFHFHALEKEMATHSSVLAWRIPGMGEPGGLLSMGSHRVGHDWSDLAAAGSFISLGFVFKSLTFHTRPSVDQRELTELAPSCSAPTKPHLSWYLSIFLLSWEQGLLSFNIFLK